MRRGTARWLLAVLVLAVVVAALTAGTGATLGDTDHAAIVSAMADGSDFYGLIGGVVPTGAFAGRLVPLPTLALVESGAGTLGTTILLCAVLAGVLLAEWDRLGAFADGHGRLLGAVMLVAGATASALLAIVEPHAGWSALLAAWSLLLRRRGRWIEAAALACAAATIDPAAIVLAVTMGAAALRDGQRREAFGWGLAIAVGGATLIAHEMALANLGLLMIGQGARVAPLDLAGAALLPGVAPWLAAPALVLAVAGWCVACGELARRVAAVAIVGLTLAHVPGMQSAAVLALALLPLGLVFAVEAGASLVAAARSRRRITVTRTTRAERRDGDDAVRIGR